MLDLLDIHQNLLSVFILLMCSPSVSASSCDEGACLPLTVQITQLPTVDVAIFPSDVVCEHADCQIGLGLIDDEHPLNYTTWSTKVWRRLSSFIPEVTVTIAFGKDHTIEDELVVSFRSEFPDAMIIEKSRDYGLTWETLQFYSTNCAADFGYSESRINSGLGSTTDVICVNLFSEQKGRKHDANDVSFLVKPRLELLSPGLADPDELFEGLEADEALREFLSLTHLRLRLLRPTFMNATSFDPENTSFMHQTAYYAISNIATTLSCNCNLHSNYCILKGGLMACECHHNTEGRSCERCKPHFDRIPWQPGSYLPVSRGTANSCMVNLTTSPEIKTTIATGHSETTDALISCESSPCLNNGTCQSSNAEFSCQCPINYSGLTCESQEDPCISNPCSVGDLTVCTRQTGGYKCTTEEDESGLSNKTIAIICGLVGGFVLFCVWVCFIIYCATFHEKVETMNRKSQKYHVQTAAKKNSDLLIPDGLSSSRVHDLQEKWNVLESNLLLGKLLSSGKFSYVCEGSLKDGDSVVENKVAVKLLKDESDEASKNELLNEFSILSTLGKHACTVELLGMCTRVLEQSNQLCMVMEFISRGSMQRILRRCRSRRRDQPPLDALPEDELLGYAYDVIQGMKHLDSLGILHMNLCAKNVLITFNNKAKLTDFGRAVEIQEPDQYTPYKPHHDEQKQRWMAYEATIDGVYNTKSEVWSYGMVLYEIVTLGGIPYADIKVRDLKEKLKEHDRMQWPRHCSQDLYNLMLSCWHRRPESRPSINLLAKEVKLFKSASKKHFCLKDYPFQTYVAIRYPEEFEDTMNMHDSFV